MADEKIVVIGGGTGTHTTLTGLREYTCNVTAVVTMADDGGSSGRLRDEFGMLPPGDIRRCLAALSTDHHINRTLRALFEYRFSKGDGLNGHSFGNLFLTALTELTGSVELAILEASRLLNIRGRVLPVTTDNVRLSATLEDGTIIKGERNIDVRTVKPDLAIRHVFLHPEAQAYPPVLEVIREADIVVIGPGDLYTSLIPNLLVRGVPEAIQSSKAVRIFVCNLMTKHGETDGFITSMFVSEINRYLNSPNALDALIVNDGEFSRGHLRKYASEKAFPVQLDLDKTLELIPQVFQGNLVASGGLLRHNSDELAKLIFHVASTIRTSRETSVPAVSADMARA